MKIYYTTQNETIQYAAEELQKYICTMDKSADVSVEIGKGDDGIQLGLLADFNLNDTDAEDTFFDDVYDIKIEKGHGYIAGSNPRSVLFGVYYFLRSAGCAWVRPGEDGEYIPEYDILNHTYIYRKKADLRIRGQMIEGAISLEHTLDSIRWMPKFGYNSFYIQFEHPYGMYKRWYKHMHNPYKADENVSHEQMEEMTYEIEKLVKKQGMLLHNLGHGYFFSPFGITYYGDSNQDPLPENVKPYVAMLNGKRDMDGGSINYTQLCYSNPEVRTMLVNYLVKFVKKRTMTDILHVYFADAANNHCECDECRKLTPSDYFVMILNELDEALTKENLDTKVFFGVYVDTLWPPKETQFKNKDRFIMGPFLFRDSNKPLPPKKFRKIPEHRLNNYDAGRGEVKSTFDYAEAWRATTFDKDFTIGTYNMYANHFYDPGHFQISPLIADDIKHYRELGADGNLDCQTMRFGFPTALPCAIMGDFNFDNSLSFDAYANDYCKSAFGTNWEQAKAYLQKITDLFSPCNLRLSEDVVIQDTDENADVELSQSYIGNETVQKKLAQIPDYVDSFSDVIEQNLNNDTICQNLSWEYLKLHGTFCKYYAKYFTYLSNKDVENAYETGEELMKWLFKHEETLGRHFDIFLLNIRVVRLMVIRMRRKLGLPETIKLGE